MAMTTMRDVQPYVDSMPLLTDPQALRQRARQDGCLFFRDCCPRTTCSTCEGRCSTSARGTAGSQRVAI